MSTDLAQTAPSPNHGNVNDPLWRKLWNAYEPLITALRRIPLVTDVEISGGMFGITAELADGSYLWVSSVEELPLDPKEAQGYLVRRAHEDNPTVDEPVYDSTEDGEDSRHGNNIVPLIQAVTAFVTERRLVPNEGRPDPVVEPTKRPCTCLIAHPQNNEERARAQAALDNALKTNNAQAVLVACMQLMQPCPARDETATP